MEDIILKATLRSEKPKKVRNEGFIPGVLNGPGTTSTSVQIETKALSKIIAKHGENAKLLVDLGSEKKLGYIKNIQRSSLEEKIIHISIQLISNDQELKIHLPINFHGHEELEHRSLQLQVCKSQVEISGKAMFMPDMAIVDVSGKEAGESITAKDFHFPSEVKILDSENEPYAIVKAVKEEAVEVPEEEKPAE